MSLRYIGQWDASTNIPNLSDTSGTTGDAYIIFLSVNPTGTYIYNRNLGSGAVSWVALQYAIYDGTRWICNVNLNGGGGSGTVTSIATSAPLTGGTITTSGTIGITQATSGTSGYLSAADYILFSAKGSGTLTSVQGTTNRVVITSGSTASPIIDIAPTYAGQPTISALGTIVTGIWNGTPVDLGSYVSGNLAVARLNSGTNSSSLTFWRGDGSWAVPVGFANPMTTAGDLLYQTSGNATARLPIGIEGQQMRVVNGLPVWQTSGSSNLTGPITSVGTATAIASQTGTGSTFAMSAAPTFTGTTTANYSTNATLNGNTKNVNVGIGGVTGSTTNVNIGSTSGTSTTIINGTVNVVGGKMALAAATTSYPSINYAAGTAPTSPAEGDMWADSIQKAEYGFIDGIKQSRSGCIFTQTADKTVTNTISETSIVGTGVGTLTLPANFFVAGKTIRLRIGGVYSTPALATPSVLIKVKYGSTVLTAVTTSSLLSGAASLEFDGEVAITCRSAGASGTVAIHGDIEYSTGVAGTIAVDALNNNGGAATIDTTTSNLLDISCTWDSATTTRIVKSIVTIAEVLN